MDFLIWLQHTSVATWVRESTSLFSFPTILFLHTIGMTLVVGIAPRSTSGNTMFLWKFILVVLAGFNDLYLMLCPASWAVGAGDDAPPNAKIFAASGILPWMGVLFSGHILPFIGNAF